MRSCHHRRSCAFSGGSRSSPCSARRPMTLAGWKLTPPVAGRKGDVATLDPAAVAPPWLVADGGGVHAVGAGGTCREQGNGRDAHHGFSIL